MCIYYGNKEDLTYNSREHIFPATIGGIEILPEGYVSDKANNYFSKLESDLITNSFLGISKSFFGPGKRGGNKPGRMPISLMQKDNLEEGLGFTFRGKPMYIPQIIISNDIKKIKIEHDVTQSKKDLNNLIKAIQEYNGKYTLIESDLKLSKFIIGYYNKRLYITTKDKNKVNEFIKYIKVCVLKQVDYSKAKYGGKEQVKTQIHMEISLDNNSRVFGKTALNYIAKLKGKDYLNNSAFDEFKNWLLGQENNKFNQFPQKIDIINTIDIPHNTHYCILINIDNSLCSIVCFYNFWTMGFTICDKFDSFFDLPQVMFCDPINHKEFSLLEYMSDLLPTNFAVNPDNAL